MSENSQFSQTGSFPLTRWTLVARLQGPPSDDAAKALDAICRAYWYPLYVFSRRCGLADSDAKDAVQDLFTRMIGGNRFAQADAERGRMRTFLLTAMKNEINSGREKRQTAKRGGKATVLSLDMTDAEGRYLHEPAAAPGSSPERAFERKWAMELLYAAKADLREIYAEDGKGALFDILSPALDEGDRWGGHEAAAAQLQMNEGAMKVALHRLRKRYREALFRRVRETVEGDEDVMPEATYLMLLFGR
jgi:DNA-directed RNA polymerase specialized sigma24 family protein